LGWLAVDVDIAAAELRLEGASLARGTEARVVAGDAVLEVKAPGFAPDARRVHVGAGEHVRIVVTLTPLVGPPVLVVPTSPRVETPAEIWHPPSSSSSVEDRPHGSPPTASIGLGALGVIGLGVGTYYGIQTYRSKADRDLSCVGGCTSASTGFDSEARTSATVSTIAFSAGLGLIATAAVWWILDPGDTASAHPPVEISPIVGAVTGLSVRGAF
ncbi:MAG: hypothetical protein ACHREM_25635, partial [Polyangiales bacterium]